MASIATSKASAQGMACSKLTCFKRTKLRQAVRVMKLTTILTVVACLQVGANAISQNITLSVKDAPLELIFKEIQRQSDYRFFYKIASLKGTKKVTIEAQNWSLEKVLEACFKEQPVTYTISDKIITLKSRTARAKIGELSTDTIPKNLTAVRGKLINKSNEPIVGATITVKGSKKAVISDENGRFELSEIDANAKLVISSVNYEPIEIIVSGRSEITQQLEVRATELTEVAVTLNTGYQKLPKERATGSFVQVSNELINRSVSTDILTRLKGISNGLFSDKGNGGTTGNSLGITIRGLSTINANTKPLIVIDNFPYEGDINNINPNDVENVTILKDAAASSIWGVRAGNGVIVITTKTGNYNKPANATFNVNSTISERPNLYHSTTVSSSDYIDLQKYLFENGFYDARINSAERPALDPVTEILLKQRNGELTDDQANAQINTLRQNDLRSDLSEFVYRRSINNQYALNISGGGPNNIYYFSAGYDDNNSLLQRNNYGRLTLTANNTYSFFKKTIELSTGIIYIKSKTENNGLNSIPFSSGANAIAIYPYAQLADVTGGSLAIPQYRQGYIDTAGGGKLLDWNYRPLDELQNSNRTNQTNELRINVGLKYKLPYHFNLEGRYQYGRLQGDNRDLQSLNSFSTRNYINRYSQINSLGQVTYHVPLGAIFDKRITNYTFQSGRLQVAYSNKIANDHELNGIVGYEVREARNENNTIRYYGYNDDRASFLFTEYTNAYPDYITGAYSLIAPGTSISATLDRFVSYYSNIAYTFKNRYTISGSGRRDGSNIFGVETNKKTVPLWSAGLAWTINNEPFYRLNSISLLRLRGSIGVQGNVDNSVSAFLTTLSGYTNSFGVTSSEITNPPNPNFRWEKTRQLNVGLDFATRKNELSGSIEYYTKNSFDLISSITLAPSTGYGRFNGNVANLKGHGVDITLNFQTTLKNVRYSANAIFNYNTNKVTSYFVDPPDNLSYTLGGMNPVVGRPLYALYSFRWAGLDTAGNPLILIDGKPSSDYSMAINNMDVNQLDYGGSLVPKFFGGLRNNFTYKNVTLSVNIVFKMGYVFRRNSVKYYDIFNSGYQYGSDDFVNRWKVKGDETRTNIPSLIYPLSSDTRDNVYSYSTFLVEKGDHIRLQDVAISYQFENRFLERLHLKSLQAYAYANNLGIIWRANDKGIDPEFLPNGSYAVFPNPKTISLGIKIGM